MPRTLRALLILIIGASNNVSYPTARLPIQKSVDNSADILLDYGSTE